MAIVNKQTLKGYFEQGDIPTQGQYMNLIDSMFNLTETGTQIIQGTFSASSAEIDYLSLKKAYLPGIGVDDAKIGTTFVVGKSLEVMGSMNVNATGSDAGNLTVEGEVSTGTLSVTGGNISASNAIVTKNISASSNISGSKIKTHQAHIHYKGVEGGMSIGSGWVVGPALDVSGSINASGIIYTSTLSETDSLTGVNINSSGGLTITGNITASGDISASGDTHTFGGNLTLINEDDPQLTIQDSTNSNKFEIKNSLAVTTISFDQASTQDLLFASNAHSKHLALDGGTGGVTIGTTSTYNKTSKLYIEGDLETSTHVTASGHVSASAVSSSAIQLAGSIEGWEDTDTKITFADDDITITVGNEQMLKFTEDDTQDIVTFGDGGDIDFHVKAGGSNTIYAQGSTDRVGIGTNTPSTKLHVAGNVLTTGYFIGSNIGHYVDNRILMKPSDFGATAGAVGKVTENGGKTTSATSLEYLYASYTIPENYRIRQARIYGDVGARISVYEGSIDSGTVSTLASAQTVATGLFSCATNTGDGLLYVVAEISTLNTANHFHGGYFTLEAQ